MGQVNLYTPVAGYTGLVAGVQFNDGIGKIQDDNPAIESYFKPAGYIVGDKNDPRVGGLPSINGVPLVKGAGDGPMIEQVVEITQAAEEEQDAKPAAKK